MQPSDRCFSLIEEFEGCGLRAYQDSVGVWTIGYGHTGGVMPGQTISLEQARQFLEADVQKATRGIDAWFDCPITQGEFDAMVSFAFNLGVHALVTSTLARKLIAGDKAGAAAEFGKWNHAGGKVLEGLTRRRAAEAALFLT